MESTPVEAPEGVAPNPEIQHSGLKRYVIGIVIVLFVGLVSYIFYVYLGNDNKFVSDQDSVQTKDENELLQNLVWSEGGRESTIEGVNEYVSDIEAQIADENLSEAAKEELLMRKAQSLSVVRENGIPMDRMGEAASIFRSIYEQKPANMEEVVQKYKTIPSFITLFYSTCFSALISTYLPDTFAQKFEVYMNDETLSGYYKRKAAGLLTMRDFAYQEMDNELNFDQAIVSGRAFISAVYLYVFGSRTPDALESEILSKLKQDVSNEELLKKITITAYIRGEADPAHQFSFAYDIANTYGVESIPKEVNEQIDAHYEEALEKGERIENDLTSRHVLRVQNVVYYLTSLHRRYPDSELDAEKVQRLISMFIESMNYNKDVMGLFTGYLLEGKTEGGKWMEVRNDFYEVATKYPELRDFISEKAGVDL